jgi:hypothetical protein
MPMRIYVDFNTMTLDPQERVSINIDLQHDLAAHLQPGLSVVLYDEEMEVEGVVEFDVEHQQWLAQPRWVTRHDLSSPRQTAPKVA